MSKKKHVMFHNSLIFFELFPVYRGKIPNIDTSNLDVFYRQEDAK